MIVDATQLPEEVERGAAGGPEFKTAIVETDGGNETANINWVYPRIGWDVGYGIQSKTDLEAVIRFFYARRGRARGFLFKDWADYQLPTGNLIGTGDSTTGSDGTAAFQIVKVYSDTVLPFSRKITRPKNTTLVVKVNAVTKTEGVHYNVNYTTGIITFTNPNRPLTGEPIVVEGEFFVPCRFVDDKLSVMVEWANAMSIPNIGIIEVRE